MNVLITSERYESDPTSRLIVDELKINEERYGLSDASLYYDYPLYRDYEQEYIRPSLLLISPLHGIVVVLVKSGHFNASDLLDLDEYLTQLHSIVFSKLLKSKLLRRDKQSLSIPLHSYIFDNNQGTELELLENAVIPSIMTLLVTLEALRTPGITKDQFNEASSIIEGSKGLSKPKQREVPDDDETSMAGILAELEEEINNFDEMQRKAALQLLRGPQRIRGLAGSGKTVILAMKAAHIHLQSPNALVLVTFHTKSLYDLMKTLISRFYRQFSDNDPNWEKIHILHSWGGTTLPGVYWNTCRSHGVAPIRLPEAKNKKEEPFAYVCGQLLASTTIEPLYDYVLMDEAQDFPDAFYLICYYLSKGTRDSKNLVWAYDELQSIFDVKIRTPAELFGRDVDGQPRIDLERSATNLHIPGYLSNDIILPKCYRNSREVLVCAHALGFGLYSQPVQMIESKDHWEDIGYEVLTDEFKVGHEVKVRRPEANSPLSLSKHQDPSEIIKTFAASSVEEEINWIRDRIVQCLSEGLEPNDIMVISLDDRHAKKYFSILAQVLLESGILCNNILINVFDYPAFVLPGHVTLTTVYRAKGNEAPVVFAIGIDALFVDRRLRTGRNKLFTAFTRAKGWLHVSGIGGRATSFFQEIAEALEHFPEMEFVYPDPAQVEMLQRDLTKRTSKARKLLKQLEALGLSDEELRELLTEEVKP